MIELDTLSSESSNILIEQKTLGAILYDSNNLEKVDFLRAEHFSVKLHQDIYKAFINLVKTNISISPTVVQSLLKDNEDFLAVQGRKYLMNLLNISLLVIDVRSYGKIVYDKAIKRQLIEISEDTIKNAKNSSILEDATYQIEITENKLHQLLHSGVSERSFTHAASLSTELIERINKTIKNPRQAVGISSGFIDLDNKLGGFHNSDFIILAGRPSMGKTALALNLALNAAKEIVLEKLELSVGIFSLEMSSTDLISRIISMHANIDSSCFLTGKIDGEEYNKIRQAIEEIKMLSLYIDDSAALTISAIRSKAKMLKRRYNLGILFIDYLQLIKCTEKMENRTLEVSEISRSLKALAKELDIPIIALSQLSRAVEQRADKRPMLSDLRESGSIEQDSDIVMFIYREEYYLKGAEPKESSVEYQKWAENLSKVNNIAELIVSKHRKGPTCNVKLHYKSKYSKFENSTNR